MQRKYKWMMGIFVVLVLFVIVANADNGDAPNGNGNGDIPPVVNTGDWDAVRAGDVPVIHESGWSAPKLAGISSDNWEDGAYISGDGETLYFAYYPDDLISDVMAMSFDDDIDVYYSKKPFTSRSKDLISEDIWSEGGVMISNGDKYYMSNKGRNDNLYKNGEKLDLDNGDVAEQDPHYCSAKEELYYWNRLEGGGAFESSKIYVYKNNEVTELPSPINVAGKSEDIQPFLTPDCETLYFSSNRDGKTKIYKSARLDDDGWATPEVVISSNGGVGEPTLTDDGNTMFFVQILADGAGNYNSDVFYIEKL